MYTLLKICDDTKDDDNIEYFKGLMLRGICLKEIIDGASLEIAIWITKNKFEQYRLVIGTTTKKGAIYSMPFCDIWGIQIGGSHNWFNTIDNDNIVGIITDIRIIWLYFPTSRSARVFRNFFDKLMTSNKKILRLQDYL